MIIKKILIFCVQIILVLYVSVGAIFAATDITISSPQNSYDIDDAIEVTITISADSNEVGEISLEGIENFQLIGKNQRQSTQNINGDVNALFTLQLSMLALEAGEYDIGPAIITLGGEKIESNSVNIEVKGERIMVNNKLKNFQPSLPIQEEDEQVDISDVNLGGGAIAEHEPLDPPKGLDGNEMTDIYPEKTLVRDYPFSRTSIIWLIYSIIVAILFLCLYKYLAKYNKTPVEQGQETIILKTKKDYLGLLGKLERSIIGEKQDFYDQSGYIIRWIIAEKLGYQISNKSLEEVQGLIQDDEHKDIRKLYATIYFPEFNTEEDSPKQREKIIEEIREIIEEHTTI